MGAKSKTRGKTTAKKAVRGVRKKAAAKQSTKKSAKKSAKTSARKGTKRTVVEKSAKKSSPKRATPARGKPKTKGQPEPNVTQPAGPADSVDGDETLLSIDELVEVDDLLADEQPAFKPKTLKNRGPTTPSVPRSVKPVPKIADVDMDEEVLAFIDAIDKYKREFSRPFPTWREIFYLVKRLGYTKP